MIEAFCKALIEHLRERVPKFTHKEQGDGGCSTCGYGAEEYDVLDMEKLEAEIDAFSASFKENKT